MSDLHKEVKFLEGNSCRYICTICDPPKSIETSKYGNLETHYLIEHSDLEITSCPYCLSSVQISSIMSHINMHFNNINKQPFFCPLCDVTKSTIKCLAHHAFEDHCVTSIDLFRKCGHCEKLFKSVSELISHIESATLNIYHCTHAGCNVKSKYPEVVEAHVKNYHHSDLKSIVHTVDYVCSWPLQRQPLVETSSPGDVSMFYLDPNLKSNAISLSCPHCPYITSNMENFARHLSTCSTGIKAGNFLSMACILYKCPICEKSSTSIDMINEHLIDKHNITNNDKEIHQEQFTVPVDEVLSREASVNLLNGTLNGKNLADGVFSNLGDINFIKKTILDMVNPPNQQNTIPSTINPFQIKSEEDLTAPVLLKTQITGKSVLPTHLTNGQPVEEWVDLYFNETDFLAAFHKAKLTSELPDFTDARLPDILIKLKHFGTLKVPIMGRANQRRVAACPVCNKNFNHGFSDLKKHLLVGHMEMSREISRFAINFTHSPKVAPMQVSNGHRNSQITKINLNPPKKNEMDSQMEVYPKKQNESLTNGIQTEGNMNGKFNDAQDHVDASTIEEAELSRPPGRGGIIPLDENGSPLKTAVAASKSDEELSSLDTYKPIIGRQRITLAYSMGVLKRLFEDYTYSYSEKLFLINRLNRYSKMFVYLDVTGQGMSCRRYCCSVCSYSSQHSLADVRKHVMGAHCGISPKRFRICLRASRHDSNNYRLCSDDKMLQYVDLRNNRNLNGNASISQSMDSSKLSICNSNPSSNKTLNEDEEFGEDFINDTQNEYELGKQNESFKNVTSSAITKDDIVSLIMENAKLNGHVNNPYEGVDYYSHNGSPINLKEGESGQRIDLPWSENVLLSLMNNDKHRPHIDTIMKKMKIYGSYHLIVVSKENRIHAYICVCGRRFTVVREDDESDIRPASLADCRRHILGVHARVSQDMLTLCCQASRISRESNYQLYADKSLLALAEHHKLRTSRGSNYSVDLSNLNGYHDDSSSDLSKLNDSNNNGSVGNGLSQRHPGNNLPATNLLTLEQGRELVLKYGLPEKWRLERVINLPYSPEVFNQMVQRQANIDQEFLSTLHSRMKTYTEFSVYMFRQDTARQKNQKFYSCSACLSTSPHGLGDMRKHILGVHAHIPEKFKGAAMAAGRLNRDNFDLYSDDQLLSLALVGGRSQVGRSSLNQLPTQSNAKFTEDLKTLGIQLMLNRKREVEDEMQPLVPLASLPSQDDFAKKTKIEEPENNNANENSYQSVWPGQTAEDSDMMYNEESHLDNEDEDEEDEDEMSKYTIDFEKSAEDSQRLYNNSSYQNNENNLSRLTFDASALKEAQIEYSHSPLNTSPNSETKRPPIILNLKLSKLNDKPHYESRESSPAMSDSGDHASKSRRSIMLKSKKPCPTSN